MDEGLGSLDELKVEIGKSIVRIRMMGVYTDQDGTEGLLAEIKPQHFIRAAEEWRTGFPETCASITAAANKALELVSKGNVEGAERQLTNDISALLKTPPQGSRPSGAETYLRPVLASLFEGDTESVTERLESLAAFGLGE